MKVTAKGLIGEGDAWGFRAVAFHQEIRDCWGIWEPICVPQAQGTNAALCEVSGAWVSPPEETTFGSRV